MADVSVDPEQIIPEQLIRVMPDALANKIAAGEVVQRPASALKELLENAIDAGADEIEVVLKSAGSELIQVVDDGCGMSPGDAEVCFRRHATSKITAIEDLERIHTLGFRGEALASIGAVAQVELKTKRVQDQAGYRVRLHGGEVLETSPCAAPNGTSIAVRNLFYNVPARRNFLKTPATEFKHLVETFQFLALSNPRVGFSLIHDDNEVYRLARAHDRDRHGALAHRINELFGSEYADQLVPIEESTSYLSIWGFVSTPEFHRRSRGEQFLFVNDRYVKNRYLEHAIFGAYGGMLPEGAYPFVTLFLQLDPRHVDVNVHPTKAEVKFDDERGIYGIMKAVVRKGLGAVDLTPQFEADRDDAPGFAASRAGNTPSMPAGPRPASFTWDEQRRPRSEPPGGGDAGGRSFQGGRSFGWTPSRPASRPADLGDLAERFYSGGEGDGERDEEGTSQIVPSGAQPAAPLRADQEGEPLLWQLHGRYIITQIQSGLMVLDQHAAHERIVYERALQAMQGGSGFSQQLLFAHTIDLAPADLELLKDLLPELHALGFEIELFSGRSIVIRGVPADIRPGDERTILEDILEQYKTYADRLQLKGRDNLAKSIARRSAVTRGARLSPKEMRSLIDQLFQCEMPYACPHGRPTLIKIPIEELDKRFGRSNST